MSRTKRESLKTKRRPKWPWITRRHPKTRATQAAELHSALDLQEAGFAISNRHAARANHDSDKLPTAWDGLYNAGHFEMDYRKGIHLPPGKRWK